MDGKQPARKYHHLVMVSSVVPRQPSLYGRSYAWAVDWLGVKTNVLILKGKKS